MASLKINRHRIALKFC